MYAGNDEGCYQEVGGVKVYPNRTTREVQLGSLV